MSDFTSTGSTSPDTYHEDAFANLQAMMDAVGPYVEAEEVREYDATAWAVAFAEDLVVVLEHDVDRGKVYFSADLGAVASSEATAVHQLLLQMNGRWRETGGLRLGLEPTNDHVTLISDLPHAGLSFDDLVTHLKDFAETALSSRQILTQSEGEGSPPADLENFMHAMRV